MRQGHGTNSTYSPTPAAPPADVGLATMERVPLTGDISTRSLERTRVDVQGSTSGKGPRKQES